MRDCIPSHQASFFRVVVEDGGCGSQVVTYERSVTWTKVSLKEAKIRATPKTSSPVDKNVLVFVLSCSYRISHWRWEGFVTYPRGPGDQAGHFLAHRARPSSWVPCLRCVVGGETAGLVLDMSSLHRGQFLSVGVEVRLGIIILPRPMPAAVRALLSRLPFSSSTS